MKDIMRRVGASPAYVKACVCATFTSLANKIKKGCAVEDKQPHNKNNKAPAAPPPKETYKAARAGQNMSDKKTPDNNRLQGAQKVVRQAAGKTARSLKWYAGLFFPSLRGPAHGKYRTGRINRRMPGDKPVHSYAGGSHYRPGAKPPRHTKDNIKRPSRHIFRKVLLGFGACFLIIMLVLGGMVLHATRNDDLWLDLSQVSYRTETILYYTNPQTGEVGEYTRLPAPQNKIYVEPEQMPQYLLDAFVAVEDKDFYDHGGFSLTRTIYAGLNEVKHWLTGSYIGGGIKQGASTINQQLVKNLTQDDQNSSMAGYMRKIREIVRAVKMDIQYDKHTILCAYLNTISFTGNTAGVQAEALKLFGKPVNELSLAECASLAAITRNPARYNPVTNPQDHLTRRNYVLAEMLEQGYITQQEYDAALAQALEVTGATDPPYEHVVTSYFTDAVIDSVIAEFMNTRGLTRSEATWLLYNGGLRIYTTVVPQLQSSMEYVMASGEYYPRPGATAQKPLTDELGNTVYDEAGNIVYTDVTVYPQAAMVSLNYEGGICAVVGGLGPKEVSRGFNRGINGARQVGSTMKPIGPYAVALQQNTITWSTTFYDGPVRQIEDENTGEMVDWPANATRRYSQQEMTVVEAFLQSTNTVAVRVGETVGDGAMYRFVKNTLHITTFTREDRDAGPLVLGSSTYGITPLEMAKAYAIYGNGGVVYEPYCFTHITGGEGQPYLQVAQLSRRAVDEDTAYIINRLMREVMVGSGSASGMSVRNGMDSVGKTGTTSDYRDHWFVGLTPYYVTASWYGYDENIALGVNAHWRPPIVAWRSVMEQAQQDLPYQDFPVSSAVQQHTYCTVSGYAAGPACPSATGYYKHNHLPQSGCPVHGE